MKGIPIIGGKLDGKFSPVQVIQLDEPTESYIRISFRDSEKRDHQFYMLCNGPTVEQAMATYKERFCGASQAK